MTASRTLIVRSSSLRHNKAGGRERIRDLLIDLGLDEIITYSLVDPKEEVG
jgi:phenylalanyl-tRNA synthetase beta subunit